MNDMPSENERLSFQIYQMLNHYSDHIGLSKEEGLDKVMACIAPMLNKEDYIKLKCIINNKKNLDKEFLSKIARAFNAVMISKVSLPKYQALMDYLSDSKNLPLENDDEAKELLLKQGLIDKIYLKLYQFTDTKLGISELLDAHTFLESHINKLPVKILNNLHYCILKALPFEQELYDAILSVCQSDPHYHYYESLFKEICNNNRLAREAIVSS